MKKSLSTRVGFCGFLMMAAMQHPLGHSPLTLNVSPSVSFAPATLLVQALIDADAGNRAIQVAAESEDFYRSSEMPLDGDHAPRTSTFEFRSLPSGDYVVSATLFGADGERRGFVRQQVMVRSGAAGN